MVYQPPLGSRDLLPLDVAQKHWVEARLEQVFTRWGYHRIITSTVESLDTLMAGGAIDRSTVVELTSTSEQLGLRPELTASIARIAVSRLAQVTYPQRLCYNANVFRRADRGSHGGQQESYQCGVELLGAGGLWADAEVLLLVADCLDELGLDRWQIVIGDAGLTQALLEPFPEEIRQRVRDAIATLDRVTLETLPLPEPLRHQALELFNLRGEPRAVLTQLSALELSAAARDIVSRLKTLMELVQQVAPAAPLILDLSLIQTFDYYTGLIFEVLCRSDDSCQVLGKGGRYDNLLGVFHPERRSFPGIGFMLSLETLHQRLLATGQLPEQTAAAEWLIVPQVPAAAAAAFTYAQTIRSGATPVRAEVHLSTDEPPEAIRAVARRRHISRIAWIDEDGLPQIEPLN